MSTQIDVDPSEEQLETAVATMKLLADLTRLRIVWALLHGEHSVNELASHIRAQPAAVSQHLAKLRLGHLVKVRRDGTRKFYAVDDVHVRQFVEEALFHADHVRSGHPEHSRTPSAPKVRRETARARTR